MKNIKYFVAGFTAAVAAIISCGVDSRVDAQETVNIVWQTKIFDCLPGEEFDEQLSNGYPWEGLIAKEVYSVSFIRAFPNGRRTAGFISNDNFEFHNGFIARQIACAPDERLIITLGIVPTTE